MLKLLAVSCGSLDWFLAHRNTPYHSWSGPSAPVPGGSPAKYWLSSIAYWFSSREIWSWYVIGPASTYTPLLRSLGGRLSWPQAASPTATATAQAKIHRRRALTGAKV